MKKLGAKLTKLDWFTDGKTQVEKAYSAAWEEMLTYSIFPHGSGFIADFNGDCIKTDCDTIEEAKQVCQAWELGELANAEAQFEKRRQQ